VLSVAAFIDAGYLFAQGSTAISGGPLPRSQIKLNSTAALAALKTLALEKATGCRLLRIYWYDGSASGRLSLDQSALASADDVKLRLGQINSVGQQKGVDSLIVTDLIELARNGAMSDALLLSGDEDVRIGVQIAQSFGVRVHLLGIEAAKDSQSPLLLQEADTTSRWTKADVDKFLTIVARPPAFASGARPATRKRDAGNLEKIAVDLAATLDDEQIKKFVAYRKLNKGVPSEFDGKLLAKARDAIGRDLDSKERSNLRAGFVEAVKKRKPALFPTT
jgi:uncharacterized LabA/DUF88 family protein